MKRFGPWVLSVCFSKRWAGALVLLLLALLAPMAQAQGPLNYFQNYFVTGDYAVAGVGLRGTGVNGYATGTINMTAVPTGADIVAAFLYWQTVETATSTPSAMNGFFNGQPIVGKLLGSSTNAACASTGGSTAPSGTYGHVYRADVRRYLPAAPAPNPNSIYLANGSFQVKLPDGGPKASAPLTDGATLVVVYRTLTPGALPLRAVVLYDGSYTMDSHTDALEQTIGGFYQATGGANSAKMTQIVANGQSGFGETLTVTGTNTVSESNPLTGTAGVRWDNPTFDISNALKPTPLFPIVGTLYTQVTASNNQTCLTWAAIVTSTLVTDTDGDGLLDIWETTGVHLNPGTATQPATFGGCIEALLLQDTCVNLPLMGANPTAKDIFVEIDWLYGPNHVHIPKLPALSAIAATFLQHGIHLHFDVGNNYQGTPQAPLPAGYTAPLSYIVPAFLGRGGDLINEETLICTSSATNTCEFPGYAALGWENGLNAIENGFGYPPNYTITPHFDHNRKDVFHYVLFAHALGLPSYNPQGALIPGVPASTSGAANRPGGDLMITLGLWPSDVAGDNETGSAQVQAGTLMHELGHNLGLKHAGGVDTPNCEPNYQSVMNYIYQPFGLTDSNGLEHVDYSYGKLPSLNEDALSATWITPYRTRYYGPAVPPASPSSFHCDGTIITNGATELRSESPFLNKVDWQNNLSYASSPPPEDVNFDGVVGQVFSDYNDWGNLNLPQISARKNVGGLSTNVGATDLGATDLGATDLGATDLGATDLGATDLGATDLGATDLGATDLGATDLGAEVDYITTVSSISATNPAQPLTATSSLTGITLNWGAPALGQIRVYNIYRSDPNNPFTTTYIGSVAGSPPVTTYTDTVTQLSSVGPAPVGGTGTYYNTPYTYYVTSVDINGTQSGPSNTANGIVNHVFITATAQNRVYGTTTFNAALYTTAGVQDPSVAGTTVCTTTAGQQSPVVPGGYPITCSGLTPNAGVTYIAGVMTINPAPLTATITASNKVYDGTNTATLTSCSVATLLPWDASVSGSVTCGGTATFNSPNVLSATTVTGNLALSGSASGNYYLTSATPTFTPVSITPAPTTTRVTCPATPVVYTGSALTPCSAMATGAGGLSTSVTVTYTNNINAGPAGSAGANATYVPDSNHTGSSGSSTFTISPAPTMTTVTCPATPLVYTGLAQTPCSATATGAALSVAVPVTYTNNINAGSAGASASYGGDSNHTGSSGNGGFTINQAPATVVLSNMNQSYTSLPLTPTATTTPPGLAITWTNAPETAAGSYAVTATVNDPNYTGSASGTFNIFSFTSLTLNGSTSGIPVATNSQMTMNTATNQTSSAWYPTMQTVGNGFTTQFQFQISADTTGTIADGFAFVIQSSTAGTTFLAENMGGGYLGYQGLTNSIAVEFDTFQNGWDPNSNHVAIQSNGMAANSVEHSCCGGSAALSVLNSSPGVTLADGNPHTVKITYDGNMTLLVYIDGNLVLTSSSYSLSNLGLMAGGNAVVGFTAATGDDSETTVISNWSF